MANTKSFSSKVQYGSRYLKIDLKQTLNNSSRTSTISGTITVLGTGNSSSSIYITTGPTTVTVGGKQMYYAARADWSTKTGIVAQNAVLNLTPFVVSHDDDGNATLACSISTAVYYTSVETTSGGNWSLDSCGAKVITPTITAPIISNTTETTATAVFSVSSNGGASITSSSNKLVLYATASSTTALQTITGYSGTFSNLSPGVTYYIRAQASNSAGTTYSTRSAFTTYSLPHIKSVSVQHLLPDYAQTISLYNPLGRSVILSLIDTETDQLNKTVRTITTTAQTWTFTLNGDEVAEKLGGAKLKSPVNYTMSYNNSLSTFGSGYTYGLNENLIGPLWDADMARASIKYKDIEPAVTAITWDNQLLVQGLSKIQMWLDIETTAAGRYGAEIEGYYVSIDNGNFYNIDLLADNVLIETASLASEVTLNVKAIDTRGLQTAVESVVVPLIHYYYPQCAIVIKRKGGYSDTLDQTTYTDWAIGENNIGEVQYRYKKSSSGDSSYSEWNVTLPENGYDVEVAYTFQARAIDKIGNIGDVATGYMKIGVFSLFIDGEQNAIGVNCFPTEAGIETPNKIKTSSAVEGVGTEAGGFWEGAYRLPIIILSTSQPSNIPTDRDVIWFDTDA